MQIEFLPLHSALISMDGPQGFNELALYISKEQMRVVSEALDKGKKIEIRIENDI